MEEKPKLFSTYFSHSIMGGFIGYFILHPISMLIMDVSAPFPSPDLWGRMVKAFSMQHLNMAAYFILLGICVGMLHAFYNVKFSTIFKKIALLEKILPLCAWCKKVRLDTKEGTGNWLTIEDYMSQESSTTITHGMCPECLVQFKMQIYNNPPKSAIASSAEEIQTKDKMQAHISSKKKWELRNINEIGFSKK